MHKLTSCILVGLLALCVTRHGQSAPEYSYNALVDIEAAHR